MTSSEVILMSLEMSAAAVVVCIEQKPELLPLKEMRQREAPSDTNTTREPFYSSSPNNVHSPEIRAATKQMNYLPKLRRTICETSSGGDRARLASEAIN